MNLLQFAFLSAAAFGGGVVSAGGFAAFITLIGVVPRLAGVTGTSERIKDYERALTFGFILMNLISLYPVRIPGLPGWFIYTVLGVGALFGGIFTGCLAGALAEVLQIFPVVSARLKLQNHIKYIIFALAIGKCIGSLVQLL